MKARLFLPLLVALNFPSTHAKAAPIECRISVGATAVEIIWESVPGTTYFVETTTNLAQGWHNAENPPDAFTTYNTNVIFWCPRNLDNQSQYFRVGQLGAPPTNMVLIPSGTFQMGDALGDGQSWEVPVHDVYVSAFYMDRYDVTKVLWDEVKTWAVTNGYDFSGSLYYTASNCPVYGMYWYDAVKWCNARSEMEGLTPAYYLSAGHTNVLRSGSLDVKNDSVDWSADGYRLPTEAEWEKAARGGGTGHRFPWTDADTITHDRANYYSDPSYSIPYDTSPTRGCHPVFACGTSPVGYFAANGYGLYDMAGNVSQWCWDYFDYYWYSNTNATAPNTHGPPSATAYGRVVRGGSASSYASAVRCSARVSSPPDRPAFAGYPGFRCVRTVGP